MTVSSVLLPTIASLRAASSSTVVSESVGVQGYYASGDGGEGTYWYNAADTTTADNGGTVIVDGSSRRWYRSIEGRPYSVKWFGAKGDGSTNDTAAITAADAAARAAGVMLHFPASVYMASQLVIYTGCNWSGDGRGTGSSTTAWSAPVGGTILRQIAGANVDFLYGNNSAANWGSSTPTTFVDGYTLRNLTVDGNYNTGSGNTLGSGVSVYGDRPILEDVFITNVAEHGLRTGWIVSNSSGSPGFGTFTMEGYYNNVKIDTCGKHGWWDAGPHDSVVMGMVIIDASRSSSNSYDGLYADVGADNMHFDFHSWTRHATAGGATVFSRYAANLQGGNMSFASSQFEGAYTAEVGIFSAGNSFDSNCRFYGAINGITISMGGTTCENNIIRGSLGPPASGAPTTVGFDMSNVNTDNISNNDIDVFCTGQETANVIFGAGNHGSNKIHIHASNSSSYTVAGTPNVSDDFKIVGTNSTGAYQIKNGYVYSAVPYSSGVSMASGFIVNVTSISLSPGTWLITGTVSITAGNGFSLSEAAGGATPNSTTIPQSITGLNGTLNYTTYATGQAANFSIGTAIVVLSAATTFYLTALQSGAGTATGAGIIQAQRL